MPFITEALWQRLPRAGSAGDGEALIVARYPQPGDGRRDESAEAEFGAVQDVVRAVRQTRADYQVTAGRWVETWVAPRESARAAVAATSEIIEALARTPAAACGRQPRGRAG